MCRERQRILEGPCPRGFFGRPQQQPGGLFQEDQAPGSGDPGKELLDQLPRHGLHFRQAPLPCQEVAGVYLITR